MRRVRIVESVVMVSSNRRGGALRNPDQLRAPPRLWAEDALADGETFKFKHA
jgi:hypothetical protein